MKTTRFQRVLSMLLVVCMVWALCPAFTLPAKAASGDTAAAAASKTVYVVAGSDFQHATGATNVTNILNQIKSAGYTELDGFLFAGDYSNGWYMSSFLDSSSSGTSFPLLQDTVNAVYPGLGDKPTAVYVQGNHDVVEAVEEGYLSPSGDNDTDNYGVYVIHEDDFSWSSEGSELQSITLANNLNAYLNLKIAASYTKPIFVVSHVPLHYTMRTLQNGDNAYSRYVFDALNKAAAKGLNIIFMYGHNHSGSWEDSHGGTSVFYTKGDKINIPNNSQTECTSETLNFTYMNAGYVGYYTALNSGTDTTLNMSLFAITDDTVTITRYSADGVHNLKSAGVPNTGYTTNTESAYFQPNTDVVESPKVITLNKNIVISGNMGVEVQGDGITSVTAVPCLTQIPTGYSYYQTYDISVEGMTVGSTATVYIPYDTSLDEERGVIVIDHKNKTVLPASLSYGNVVFETTHFSHFTVAQQAAPATWKSTLTDTSFKWFRTVLTAEGMQQDIPYVITESTLEGGALWMVTGTAATKSGYGTGLLLESAATVSNAALWYFDGTYIRYGSPTGKYMNLTGSPNGVVLSDTVDTAASAIPVQLANSRRHNFQRADGTSVYLNRHGGTSTDNVALTFSTSSYSRWYVHELITSTVSLEVTPSANWMSLQGGSIQMSAVAPVVTTAGTANAIGTINVDEDVVLSYRSLDTSIATVDENGLVTPVAAGQAYIRCRLESVDGYPVNNPVYVDVLVTVVDYEATNNYRSVSTHFGTELGSSVKFDTANMPTSGGPYAIREYYSKYKLTNTEMLTDSEGRIANHGYEGLEMTPNAPLYGGWYLDADGFKFGLDPDDAQHLVYVGNKLTMGAPTDGKTFTFTNSAYGTDNAWNIYTLSAADKSVYALFRNGLPNNVATRTTASGSYYWQVYSLLPDRWVELQVSPLRVDLIPGYSQTVVPTVNVNALGVDDYTVEWTSSDTAVCTVDSNGVITAVSHGDAHITATLISADGRALTVPISVELDVNVGSLTVTSTETTAQISIPSLTQVTDPVEGTPYLISSNVSVNYDWVWTNNFKPSVVDGSYTGIDMEPFAAVSQRHMWYIEKETVDGVEKMYVRYGNLEDEDNYLVVDSENNRTARLGTKEEALYDTWTKYSDGAWRPYSSATSCYLNQYGGQNRDTAVPTIYYGDHTATRWRFNMVSDTTYSMKFMNEYEVLMGHSCDLNPTVYLNGSYQWATTNQFKVSYVVDDPTIAYINDDAVYPNKAGTTTVTATLESIGGNTTYSGISVTFTVTVYDIESISVDYKEGSLPINSSDNAALGSAGSGSPAPTIIINYTDGSQKQIPVTPTYLRTASDEAVSTATPGTLNNLKVVYKGITVCNDFTLYLSEILMDPDPTFPNEGSVKLGKTATDLEFWRSSLAKIDLSVKGIPARKGIDVIVMLDTSSSMNGTPADHPEEDAYRRINVLCESLNNLVTGLQEKSGDMDIRLSVADFNGNYVDSNSHYYLSSDDVLLGTNRRAYTTNNTVFTMYNQDSGDYDYDEVVSSSDYVPGFMKVEHIGTNPFTTQKNYPAEMTSGQYTLQLHSGTNYDYAFDMVYQLGEAAANVDAQNGEYRDVFVIFMSDGAPYQYNYFSGWSSDENWVDWLNGTAQTSQLGPNANASYMNTEGNHWMAEAIKGDRDSTYPVIRKNDDRDLDGDNFIEVPGLGATMFSIGFCLKDDNDVSAAVQQEVLTRIASNSENVHFAETSEELNNAFTAISANIVNAASGAYYIDEMADLFHVKLGNHTYSYTENGETITKTFTDNKIQVKSYAVYTFAEYYECLNDDDPSNDFSRSLIGTRKLDEDGNEIYTLLEEVTFSPDGTEAYSNLLEGNIMTDSVIYASTFIYNATTDSCAIDTDGDGINDLTITAETFYWKVERIEEAELVLSYYVYFEGNTYAGIYPTNNVAYLRYKNYLGTENCIKYIATPRLAYGKGSVGFGMYLVDKDGNPIIDAKTGETGSFQDSVRFQDGNVRYLAFNAGSGAVTIDQSTIESYLGSYRMYDEGAAYKVLLNRDGTGQFWLYSDGEGEKTTYVQGLKESFFVEGSAAGYTETTTDFATGNTIVWFAIVSTVEAKEDTVVIDYGLPVEIHPLVNDTAIDAEDTVLAAIGELTEMEFSIELYEGYVTAGGTYQLSHGVAEILNADTGVLSDATIRYTPQAMTFATKEAFSYAFLYSGNEGTQGYHYGTVKVIPATTIYFEDTLENASGQYVISYSCYNVVDGEDVLTTGRTWKNTTSDIRDTAIQAEDIAGAADSIYGTDKAYNYRENDSLNCARYTDVYEGQSAKVTFTIVGTGFDVVSRVNSRCGSIVVTVTDKATGESTSQFVNTYTDYVYNTTDKVWENNSANTTWAYRQTPIIKFDMQKYSTYEVEIYIAYNEWLNTNGKEYVRFYMDGVRVYNPAGFDTITDQDIISAYKADNEYLPTYEEVRNLLLDPDDNGIFDEDSTINGVFFVSGTDQLDGSVVAEALQYYHEGPNNEVYLRYNQSITFDLDFDDNVDKVYIALKGTQYTAAANIVGLATDTQEQISKTLVIAHNAELYYDISEYNHRTVTITNTNNNPGSVLAMTTIKTTHTDPAKQVRSAISTNPTSLARALNYLSTGTEVVVPTVTLDHPTIAFEDEIIYNLYFSVSDMTSVKEMGLITFDSKLTEGTIDDAVSVIPGAVASGDLYMASSEGVAAKNMGDTVYFKTYVQLTDGTYVYSDIAGYNAVAYANTVLAGTNEAAKTLVVAMLNYGAAAQTQFGYNTDSLMNAGLTADQKALVSDFSEGMVNDLVKVDAAKGANFAKTGGFSNIYPKVSFEGSFAINYYAAPSETVDDCVTMYYWNQAAVEGAEVLSADNATGIVTMSVENGVYTASISEIAAKQIDETFVVAIEYQSNGETYCSGPISYSLGAYCLSLANNADPAVSGLAQATATYGYYAKSFFAN